MLLLLNCEAAMPLGLCSSCYCWQLLDCAGWITGARETQVKLLTEDKTSGAITDTVLTQEYH